MWQQLQAEEQPTGTSGQRSKAATKRARKKAANQAANANQNKQAAKRAAEPAVAGPRKAHDQAAKSEQQLFLQPAQMLWRRRQRPSQPKATRASGGCLHSSQHAPQRPQQEESGSAAR